MISTASFSVTKNARSILYRLFVTLWRSTSYWTGEDNIRSISLVVVSLLCYFNAPYFVLLCHNVHEPASPLKSFSLSLTESPWLEVFWSEHSRHPGLRVLYARTTQRSVTSLRTAAAFLRPRKFISIYAITAAKHLKTSTSFPYASQASLSLASLWYIRVCLTKGRACDPFAFRDIKRLLVQD